ncbi:MAG: lipoyl(octanoyl) transferase LipB [Candidatus Bostrichicola ureolyticus]|nr:MAG: lipoyl(octanoyl) transferase LipB [Candidatus Bostrichicola ureolyticus]
MLKNIKIFFKDLGIKDYYKSWIYQKKLVEKIINQKKNIIKNTSNYLLFVEHPHVYTLGRTGNYKHLLLDKNFLKNLGASFYKTDRGGDITYHGPGQLVVYPILDMELFFTDINKYLRFLEEVIIQTLRIYGIKGLCSKGETGVWLDVGKSYTRKICAIGIRINRWVTMHGLALNINTDLRYFNYIIPCGIHDKSVTSLAKELHSNIDMNDVKNEVKKAFKKVFNVKLINISN